MEVSYKISLCRVRGVLVGWFIRVAFSLSSFFKLKIALPARMWKRRRPCECLDTCSGGSVYDIFIQVNILQVKKRKCVCGQNLRRWIALTAVGSASAMVVHAQTANGANGLGNAASAVAGYFDAGCKVMYAIGAVVGIIGAVKVYQKWSHGDHDTSKVAASWFGACIFLVVVATILEGFFGVT